MINAIVMASGFAKRMGENKLLINYKSKTIIEHLFDKLKDIELNEVIVVSQYEEILDLSRDYGYKPVYNNNAHIGQSESIKLGILNSSRCDGFMFFVGDQPLLDKESLEKLIDKFEDNKNTIVIPKNGEKKGNPVIFPYNKKDELLRLKDDEKGKKVIKLSKDIVYIEVKKEMLFDIDTKEDLKILLNNTI